jgi:hypothetical protein
MAKSKQPPNAGGGLGEEQLGCGGLEVGGEEGSDVAVAGGVDADADAVGRASGRWRCGAGLW